jgi:hypothetical protein
MSNPLFATGLAAALCISTASAQSYFFPSDTPAVGTCNVIPFGTTATSTSWANQKYQCMATQAELGNVPVGTICDLAFAPCGAGSGNYHFDTIEIVLAQSNQATLSTAFAANLMQNPQVVLQATNYDWNVTGDQWNRIGFDRNYLYLAGNHPYLVIQITVTGTDMTGALSTGFHRDGTHQRVYSVGWTTAAGPAAAGSSGLAALKWEVSFGQADLHSYGVGCTGSNGTPALTLSGDGKINGTVGIDVANCMVTTPVFHVFGLFRYEPRIPLSLIGAPGCYLYQPTNVILGGVSNTSGVYTLSSPIPNTTALLCARLYTQVFPFDRNANSWGNSASNYGRILVGN